MATNCSLPPVLRLRRRPRLPLHVRRIVRAAVLQRAHVIDDPTRARFVRLARRRARVRPAECLLRMRVAGNPPLRVALDARTGTTRAPGREARRAEAVWTRRMRAMSVRMARTAARMSASVASAVAIAARVSDWRECHRPDQSGYRCRTAHASHHVLRPAFPVVWSRRVHWCQPRATSRERSASSRRRRAPVSRARLARLTLDLSR